MSKSPIVILGGGPTGLGAAYMLESLGFEDWVLYERDDVVGGLARSYQDERGYTWDVGGHVTFSHYGLFTRLMDGLLESDGWIDHERESWIRILGNWVPYPFQNNIHRLPPKERAACATGLIAAALKGRRAQPANFDEFISATFGSGVADLFMRPYNFKVWAYPPEKLDAGWIAERVSVPDPLRIVRNLALGADDAGWGPNNLFRFPAHGGTGAIWKAVAAGLPAEKIVTGSAAVEVDPAGMGVILSTGARQQYDALISTIPLNELAGISGRRDWQDKAAGLVSSAAHIVGVGLTGEAPPELRTKCWMYFPEDNCPFYRVTHFSLYSPNNSPDIGRYWTLMCEVSESPDKPVDASRVVDDTIAGLVAAGLIGSRQEVAHTWSLAVPRAYPTPTPGRDAILSHLLPEMQGLDIYSRGRFGAWLYEVGNMDHCFMQGVEAVRHLLFGSPELTIWHPDVVNQPHRVLGWDLID